jgi:hypothetical protein
MHFDVVVRRDDYRGSEIGWRLDGSVGEHRDSSLHSVGHSGNRSDVLTSYSTSKVPAGIYAIREKRATGEHRR